LVAEIALIERAVAAPARRRGSLRPAVHALRGKIGRGLPDLTAVAADRWIVEEGTPVEVRPARCLPGQIERVGIAAFGSHDEVVRDLRGGFESRQSPTIAYRLRHVLLFDGVLHADGAWRHLRPRSRHFPVARSIEERGLGALYESWPGNRWFGNWLIDDCLTYRLAEGAGRPITTQMPIGHMRSYERALGMTPERVQAAWFDDLVMFEDRAHNEGRRERADDLRHRLVGEGVPEHPGVYLLRGTSGARRTMTNEHVVVERLTRRGFRILDPIASSLDEIVHACAGARIVAGIEGSHLCHGLMTMPRGAGLFVIQPPDRAVTVLKLTTDRQGQDFGFVVGKGTNEAFSADIDEIERTLDLF